MTTTIGTNMRTPMDNWKRQITLSFLVCIAASKTMADTNFVHALNQKWAQHDVTNLLAFVENSAATNPCLETVAAKGLIYGFVITRGVTATNLFEEARILAQTSTNPRYSDEEEIMIGDCIRGFKDSFVNIASLFGGGLEEDPSTNMAYIAELFDAWPDKPPYANYIELFATLGTKESQ